MKMELRKFTAAAVATVFLMSQSTPFSIAFEVGNITQQNEFIAPEDNPQTRTVDATSEIKILGDESYIEGYGPDDLGMVTDLKVEDETGNALAASDTTPAPKQVIPEAVGATDMTAEQAMQQDLAALAETPAPNNNNNAADQIATRNLTAELQSPAGPVVSAIGTNGTVTQQGTVVNWAAVNGATGYEVQISRNEDFSDPLQLQNQFVSTNEFHLPDFSQGTFYIRVRAVQGAAETRTPMTGWSGARQFNMQVTYPVYLTPLSFAQGGVDVNILDWASSDNALVAGYNIYRRDFGDISWTNSSGQTVAGDNMDVLKSLGYFIGPDGYWRDASGGLVRLTVASQGTGSADEVLLSVGYSCDANGIWRDPHGSVVNDDHSHILSTLGYYGQEGWWYKDGKQVLISSLRPDLASDILTSLGFVRNLNWELVQNNGNLLRFFDSDIDSNAAYQYEIRPYNAAGQELIDVAVPTINRSANYDAAYQSSIQPENVLVLINTNEMGYVNIGQAVPNADAAYGHLDPISETQLLTYLGRQASDWEDADHDGIYYLYDPTHQYIYARKDTRNGANSIETPLGVYYAIRREIPKDNICFLTIPTEYADERKDMGLANFQNLVIDPIHDYMVSHNLTSQITSVASVYHFPLLVKGRSWEQMMNQNLWGAFGENALNALTYAHSVALGASHMDPQDAGHGFSRLLGDTGYLCTRLDAQDAQTVRTNVIDNAIYAEQNFLHRGSDWIQSSGLMAFIDYHGPNDPRYQDGDTWFLEAAGILGASGIFGGQGDNWDMAPDILASFLHAHPEYDKDQDGRLDNTFLFSGWYHYADYQDYYNWAPGAIGWSLDSFSGGSFQHNEGDYIPGNQRIEDPWGANVINGGAAASLGAVNEPTLPGHTMPNYFNYYLLQGYSFAEAGYYATWNFGMHSGYFTMAYDGDPLYRPFSSGEVEGPRITEILRDGVLTGYRYTFVSGLASSDYREYDLNGRLVREQILDGTVIHYLEDGRTVFDRIGNGPTEGNLKIYDAQGNLIGTGSIPNGAANTTDIIKVAVDGSVLVYRYYQGSDDYEVFNQDGLLMDLSSNTQIFWNRNNAVIDQSQIVTGSFTVGGYVQDLIVRINRPGGSWVEFVRDPNGKLLSANYHDALGRVVATLDLRQEATDNATFFGSYTLGRVIVQMLRNDETLDLFAIVDYFETFLAAFDSSVAYFEGQLKAGQYLGLSQGSPGDLNYHIQTSLSFDLTTGNINSIKYNDGSHLDVTYAVGTSVIQQAVLYDVSGNIVVTVTKNEDNNFYHLIHHPTGVVLNNVAGSTALALSRLIEAAVQYAQQMSAHRQSLVSYLESIGQAASNINDLIPLVYDETIFSALSFSNAGIYYLKHRQGGEWTIYQCGVNESGYFAPAYGGITMPDGVFLSFDAQQHLVGAVLLDGTKLEYQYFSNLGRSLVIKKTLKDRTFYNYFRRSDGTFIIAQFTNGNQRIFYDSIDENERREVVRSVNGVVTFTLGASELIKTVEDVLRFAKSGDIIQFQPGTYQVVSQTLNRNLTFKSMTGNAGDVVFDTNGILGRHFTVEANAVVVFEGITFRNGGQGNGSVDFGGSFNITNANVTFRNCVFENNDGSIMGAGALHIWGGNVTMENCVFRGNSANTFSFFSKAVDKGDMANATGLNFFQDVIDGPFAILKSLGYMTASNCVSNLFQGYNERFINDLNHNTYGVIYSEDQIKSIAEVLQKYKNSITDYQTAGAIYISGGILTVINSLFENNGGATSSIKGQFNALISVVGCTFIGDRFSEGIITANSGTTVHVSGSSFPTSEARAFEVVFSPATIDAQNNFFTSNVPVVTVQTDEGSASVQFTAVPAAHHYEIQVVNTENSQTVHSGFVTDLTLLLSSLASGSYSVQVRAVDAHGMLGSWANAAFSIEGSVTPPPVIQIVGTVPVLTNLTELTVNYTLDGVAQVATFNLQEGENTGLQIVVRDAQQNVLASYDLPAITLDTHAPVIVVTSQVPAVTNQAQLTVTYTVDGGSVQTRTFTLAEGDNAGLVLTAVDAAGNQATYALPGVALDTKLPVIVVTSTVPALTNQSQLVVNYTVDGGGVQTQTFTLVEGNNTGLTITVTDAAGNRSSQDLPAIRYELPNLGETGIKVTEEVPEITNQNRITINYSLNGVAQTQTFQLAEGVNQLVLSGQDRDGKPVERTFSVVLDTVAPVIALQGGLPEVLPIDSLFVTYTVDGESRMIVLPLEEGDNTNLRLTAVDAAGNESFLVLPNVRYEKPPVAATVNASQKLEGGGSGLDSEKEQSQSDPVSVTDFRIYLQSLALTSFQRSRVNQSLALMSTGAFVYRYETSSGPQFSWAESTGRTVVFSFENGTLLFGELLTRILS